MGNTETFASRMKSGASDAFQTKGAQIMKLADLIYNSLRGKLDGCRDHNGMPMEPAKVRAISLNAAQRYLKITGA